jgi:hypothetical protein
MSFKKDGGDPITARPTIAMGGLNWVINAALVALGFVAPVPGQKTGGPKWPKGKRKQPRRKPKRNMVLVSKRVRRKHRRQAA